MRNDIHDRIVNVDDENDDDDDDHDELTGSLRPQAKSNGGD